MNPKQRNDENLTDTHNIRAGSCISPIVVVSSVWLARIFVSPNETKWAWLCEKSLTLFVLPSARLLVGRPVGPLVRSPVPSLTFGRTQESCSVVVVVAVGSFVAQLRSDRISESCSFFQEIFRFFFFAAAANRN